MNKKEHLVNLFSLKKKVVEDPEKVIAEVYNVFRNEFIQFGLKMNSNKEDVVDAYQDAIVALHHNLMWDKVLENSSSVKTYLFSIGKHKILNSLKGKNNQTNIELEMPASISIANSNEKDSTMLSEKLIQSFDLLGETCKKILDYYYYRRYSIEAIKNALDMKSENSVKANKSRCIKQLRNIMNERKFSIKQKEV